MALAEHATAAAMAQAPEQKSNNTGRSNGSETMPLSDAEKTASAPPNTLTIWLRFSWLAQKSRRYPI
jgi:hypothetical protein